MSDFLATATRIVRDPAMPDLTLRQIAVINYVGRRAKAPHVREIAKGLALSKPVVTRATKRLAELGLVDRTRPVDDLRCCIIQCTPAGRDMLEDMTR